MQICLLTAELDPLEAAEAAAAASRKHREDHRLHQARLAASIGIDAAKAAPWDEEMWAEEAEEEEAQWPLWSTRGSAGNWQSAGESWSSGQYHQYHWHSNSGDASGKSWTTTHLQRRPHERQWW